MGHYYGDGGNTASSTTLTFEAEPKLYPAGLYSIWFAQDMFPGAYEAGSVCVDVLVKSSTFTQQLLMHWSFDGADAVDDGVLDLVEDWVLESVDVSEDDTVVVTELVAVVVNELVAVDVTVVVSLAD